MSISSDLEDINPYAHTRPRSFRTMNSADDSRELFADWRPEWWDDASCGGVAHKRPNSNPWFPHRGRGGNQGEPRADLWAEARPICEACPVRAQCLALALKTERSVKTGDPTSRAHRYGMFGGFTPIERARIADHIHDADQRTVADYLANGGTYGEMAVIVGYTVKANARRPVRPSRVRP